MLTYHILRLLQDNGFGVIDTDLFWEKLPLDKSGIAIFSRGGETTYGAGRTKMQSFDLYCRGKSDMGGVQKLEKVMDFFAANYDETCQLPIIPGFSERIYNKATFASTDNIENLGLDENDRVIWRLGAIIYYQKEN